MEINIRQYILAEIILMMYNFFSKDDQTQASTITKAIDKVKRKENSYYGFPPLVIMMT